MCRITMIDSRLCIYFQLLSCVPLFVTLWTVIHQAPLPMGFSRQEYGSELHFFLQGLLPTKKLNPCLLH